MSNKDAKPDRSGFSLQDEIKKRKTQEIQRTVEAKRATQTGNTVPDFKRTSQTLNALESRPDLPRATQTIPRVQPPPVEVRRTTQSIAIEKHVTQSVPAPAANHMRRNLAIAGVATLLAIVVLVGSFTLARNAMQTVTPAPTAMAPLPAVSADDVIRYLTKASFPISNLRQLPVDPTVWLATQEFQFDAQRGGNKVTFIVLSYPSADQAVADNFKAKSSTKFKDWQVTSISNILVLTSPEAAPDIKNDMASHLTSYLLAPYRSFLPTATPAPTSAATLQATP